MAKKDGGSEIAKNKKAYFDLEIIEEYEAGIMLKGHEVKAIREGKVNLKGAHVSVFTDGAYVLDMHIGQYKQAGLTDYHPKGKRKLLLKAKEIDKLRTSETTAGLTIVPLKMYYKKGLIKLKVAIAKGKKQHDKRADLKKKAQNRDVDRALKHYR